MSVSDCWFQKVTEPVRHSSPNCDISKVWRDGVSNAVQHLTNTSDGVCRQLNTSMSSLAEPLIHSNLQHLFLEVGIKLITTLVHPEMCLLQRVSKAVG